RKCRLGNAEVALAGSRRCELCGAAARRRCRRCRLTYYCDVDHQKADWVSIHEQICQLLIPIRTSLPFLLSEKQRKHDMEQLVKRQVPGEDSRKTGLVEKGESLLLIGVHTQVSRQQLQTCSLSRALE
uniref:MYND-type domain-containing protein n=1 Tax=Otus sunia TaxID=257818 RepID=A0A8C8AQQ1_9STRI